MHSPKGMAMVVAWRRLQILNERRFLAVQFAAFIIPLLVEGIRGCDESLSGWGR
ncbi:MAG: hypothetical protein P8L85_18200 [Rubripirellula sp.]|nr:hypothetical protein [Rubripirellula sp.]